MQLRITPTEEIWSLDGVECRRWSGVDEEGLTCDVFVHRIGSAAPALQDKLSAAVLEMPPPVRIKIK